MVVRRYGLIIIILIFFSKGPLGISFRALLGNMCNIPTASKRIFLITNKIPWLISGGKLKTATYLPQNSLLFIVHSEVSGPPTFECPTLCSNWKYCRCFWGAYCLHKSTSTPGKLYTEYWRINPKSFLRYSRHVMWNEIPFLLGHFWITRKRKQSIHIKSGKNGTKETIMWPRIAVISAKWDCIVVTQKWKKQFSFPHTLLCITYHLTHMTSCK